MTEFYSALDSQFKVMWKDYVGHDNVMNYSTSRIGWIRNYGQGGDDLADDTATVLRNSILMSSHVGFTFANESD